MLASTVEARDRTWRRRKISSQARRSQRLRSGYPVPGGLRSGQREVSRIGEMFRCGAGLDPVNLRDSSEARLRNIPRLPLLLCDELHIVGARLRAVDRDGNAMQIAVADVATQTALTTPRRVWSKSNLN